MPYPLTLPTISHLIFSQHFRSTTHPSLPFKATIARNALRSALQVHSRLTSSQQSSHLTNVLSALQAYTPLLLALATGLSSSQTVAGEEIDVVLLMEIRVRWHPVLSQGRFIERKGEKVEAQGLDAEIALTLWIWAAIEYLQAKALLRTLYDVTGAIQTPSEEQRVASISAAMKFLLSAASIHRYLSKFVSEWLQEDTPVDIAVSTLSAFVSLTLAEATLLAVLKDDPYTRMAVAQRDVNDIDWMIGVPKMPKVRAHLLARICIAAGDHADRAMAEAQAELTGRVNASRRKLDEDFLKYLQNLKGVSRAKACRFLATDAEATGSSGKAVGWLRVALHELGDSSLKSKLEGDSGVSKTKSLVGKVKKDWKERREDERLGKDGEWGSDAGRLEEIRVIEMLLVKWEKLNNAVNTQPIPPIGELLCVVPSGRECHSPKDFVLPSLTPEMLASMRGPPDPEDTHLSYVGIEEDDNIEERATPKYINLQGRTTSFSNSSEFF